MTAFSKIYRTPLRSICAEGNPTISRADVAGFSTGRCTAVGGSTAAP
ncbi:hypothetical protein AB0E85_36770 [Streptomyces sp. NPDC029044]